MLKKEGAIQKKFMRFKQLADQSLFRAEKTELSDELHNAEKRLDILRGVLSSLVKRISASLQAPGVTDLEKRLKKMPASSVEATLNESSVAVGDGLLCDVLTQAAQATHCVMKEQQQMEENIEKNILPYFQALLDTDIPAIKKTKQTLSKLTLDMDAIKSRQLAASKQNSDHPSSSNQSKSTSLSNDYEDAANKVTTCKDQYTTELFTFLAREAEICEKIVEWMEAQSIFHALCKSSLENYIPEMLCSIASHSVRPVYGTPLEEHLEGTNREIALVIETCVSFLFENCMDEEGLFRIAPPASKLRKIKAAFNAGKQREMADLDAHVVAGALKLYIRELPEPLLTFSLFDNFIQCVGIKDRNDRLRELWNLIDQLPKANFDNTRHLIKFLAELSKNSAVNKMTPSNIAIVFGPNLLYSQSSDDGQNLAVSSVQNAVVEMLVENENYFFPGEITLSSMVSSIWTDDNPTMSSICGDRSSSNRDSVASKSSSDFPHNTTLTDDSEIGLALNNGMSSSTDTLNESGTGTAKYARKISLDNISINKKLFSRKNKSEPKKLGKFGRSIRNLTGSLGLSTKSKEKSTKSDSTTPDSVEAELLESPQTPIDNEEDYCNPVGEVVVRSRYQRLPIEALRHQNNETWFNTVAPLASDEGDLHFDPPARSFPLPTEAPPNYQLDRDVYSTAFALSSLSGDGLKYLQQARAISHKCLSTGTLPKLDEVTDHNIVDLDHISNSSLELSSFGSPIPKVNTSSLKDFGENGQSHVSSLETTAVPNNVTSPQASITSLDSISNLSSPQPPRRNKKLAPKPPVQSPGVMKRSESLRKPNDAPPISRPTNPPPPCPSTPTMAPTTKFDQASLPLIVTDSSPISSQSSLIGNANSLLPMPMGMSSSVNRRRPSLDEGSRESSPKPFVPGHNRARSDFTQMKSKVPPPIPNRVNSVSTNHNYVSPAMLRKASNQSPNSTGGVTFDVDSLASDASAQKVANRDRLASNDDATLL